MVVYDNSGRSYFLKETKLSGGEGKIYSVAGNSHLCAKIFKDEKRTKGREAKILEWESMYVRGLLPEGFLEQVVVPQCCLYDDFFRQDVRSFVGYLMEKQKGFRSLQKVYTENDLDYMEKVWVARNLCVLTNRIHIFEREIVIGDYNADNLAVFMSSGRVKFIDVDSFQLNLLRNGKRILCPCTVGVPEFMAPEISRRLRKERTDLENIAQGPDNPIFTKYTDLYAMAYHIFSLLMNGSAPYASMPNMEELARYPSKTVSNVDIDRFHAADKGDFVFAKKSLFKKPPEYAPKYSILTQELRNLFKRAFIDGARDPASRPNASEFYNALNEYLESLELRPCGHYMPSYYSGPCEWCRLEKMR